MSYGVKLTFETELDERYSSDKEGLGTVHHEGDSEFIWLKGVAGVTIGAVVAFYEDDYQPILFGAAATPGARLAVACHANEATEWGWYQIRGPARHGILAGLSCAAGAMLSAYTAGILTDTTDQQDLMANGIVLHVAAAATIGDANGATPTAGGINYPNAATYP